MAHHFEKVTPEGAWALLSCDIHTWMYAHTNAHLEVDPTGSALLNLLPYPPLPVLFICKRLSNSLGLHTHTRTYTHIIHSDSTGTNTCTYTHAYKTHTCTRTLLAFQQNDYFEPSHLDSMSASRTEAETAGEVAGRHAHTPPAGGGREGPYLVIQFHVHEVTMHVGPKQIGSHQVRQA